jgi:hypothetical protein
LRERAVSDPRAAEILLRWLQRPRAEERVAGVDLDSSSERELERLYAGLVRLAALPDEELRALVARPARRRRSERAWIARGRGTPYGNVGEERPALTGAAFWAHLLASPSPPR